MTSEDIKHQLIIIIILQSQFTENFEKGFKKAKNSEQNVLLLLFLFTPKKKKKESSSDETIN